MNTAEIISYNSPCLFYFRGVKCLDGEETHMMLVAFLQYLSTKNNERNLCQDLLTLKN